MLAWPLLIFVVASVVVGNTETFMVSFPIPDQPIDVPLNRLLSGKLVGDLKLSGQLLSSHYLNPELKTCGDHYLRNGSYTESFVKVSNYDPGVMYNVRFCWPATFPASVSLKPVADAQGNQYVLIEHYPKFYSHIDGLLESDLAVPFDLHMVPTKAGVPRDLFGVISLVISVVVGCLTSINPIFGFIVHEVQ